MNTAMSIKQVVLLGLVAFASCNHKGVDPVQVKSLEAEVMAIHDEVMPRMGEVVKLADKLDSLVLTSNDSTSALQVKAAAEQLHHADKAMMHWMRNYHKPEEPYDTATINYLGKEKVKVEELRLQILTAIEKGNSIVK